MQSKNFFDRHLSGFYYVNKHRTRHRSKTYRKSPLQAAV